MSSPPLPSDSPSTPRRVPPRWASDLATSVRSMVPEPVAAGASTVTRPARAVAFWGAIALPFLNLGLLLRGLSDPSETLAFLVLLAVNVAALLVGHPYRSG